MREFLAHIFQGACMGLALALVILGFWSAAQEYGAGGRVSETATVAPSPVPFLHGR